ncbi:hypothetical protein CMUS01_00753 [Colletotrichum musicola]|uniref:Uncharacterized protein n=2 Tax=Colletotrichum orchidearum species complex TaxID=2707337 RepID=A0A8H6NYC9_9PEZI|nr:hypothetical protein CPLU01_02057 [Colletotrichum plurivorum]KAF6844819.1 hypothetical protein CMUS01_00753 [Colletotrichum musicola]
MPYYARTKGRTQEIPPDGTRSPFLGSGARSPLPPRTPLNERPQSRSLPDLSADVRAALQAPKHDDVTYRHGFWTRCRCCRAGRDPLSLLRRVVLVPLADALQFLEGVAESIPPVVPALLAVLFLLVALPLMIAWDVV